MIWSGTDTVDCTHYSHRMTDARQWLHIIVHAPCVCAAKTHTVSAVGSFNVCSMTRNSGWNPAFKLTDRRIESRDAFSDVTLSVCLSIRLEQLLLCDRILSSGRPRSVRRPHASNFTTCRNKTAANGRGSVNCQETADRGHHSMAREANGELSWSTRNGG